MGNAVPRMCDDVSTVDGTRCRSVDGPAARGKAVPRMCDDVSTVDGSRCRSVDGSAARMRGAKVVPQRREVEREQAGGGGGPVCETMKVVLTRKEAERLIARLQEDNSARERQARIAELTGQLRAGDGGRMQEAWKPRLRTIQEN